MSALALRRVFRIVNGGTPTSDAENWDGEVPWATPMDLAKVNGGVLGATNRTLTSAGLRSGSAAVPAGSLIVSTRAPIGYVAEVHAETAFNQGCRGLARIRPIDARFFRYQLSVMASRLQGLGSGSTFVELSTEALASARLEVPAVERQGAIADFLDAETARIDAVVRRRQRVMELMREQRAATEETRILELSEKRMPLGRFVRNLGQGVSPVAADRPTTGNEWGVLKLSSVKDGCFQPEQNKTLDPDFDPTGHLRPASGDILVTRANTPNLVGATCYVAETPPRMLLSDLIYKLTVDQRGVLPEFAAYALRTAEARAQLSAAARGSSQSMVKLRGEDIKQVTIPVPSLTEQAEVVRRLNAARAVSDATLRLMVRQVDLMSERRQALVTAAVTGEIDVTARAS